MIWRLVSETTIQDDHEALQYVGQTWNHLGRLGAPEML